jgi:hypothetical protein
MTVLPYIRRVLEIYAGGDENHLSLTLLRDNGPDPDAEREKLNALIASVEEQALAIAQVLAGGRMVSGFVDSHWEDFWTAAVEKNVKSIGTFWPDLPVSVPTKSDLIDIGVIHLVLERLESGIDRVSRLDLLSIVLPERIQHLQTMFSEAHFNYVLGNRTAVTIMCRALLEAALKDKAPGNITVDGERKTLDDRLEEAKENGWLDPERTACAREVVKVGNLAAHDSSKFAKYSDAKIEEILINTRKILTDLYP